MTSIDGAGPARDDEVISVAAERGPLAMEAVSLNKDFRLGRGEVLHAVRGVSFGLYRGAVVALVGESGSGKSTVARLLAGQEHPTGGSIRLDGEPVEMSSRRAFRQHKSKVQLVFQDPFSSLNPVHTVQYHLERPVKLHRGTRSSDETAREVTALLEQVRLTPAGKFLPKFPHELSGGQRQRVSFARALAARPSVLLADEPVSMLDVSIRLEMLSLLDDLRRRFQLALLYITHDIASARYFADEVLVMYGGEIVERGPAEELTQRPAHPYTQLLVASAPDPDNLGSTLRGGTGQAGPSSPRPGIPTALGAHSAPLGGTGQAGPSSPRPGIPTALGAHSAALGGTAPGGTAPGTAAAGRQPAGTGPAVTGCPFSARCPLADDRCRADDPPLRRVSAVRAAACWRLDVAAPGILAQSQGGGT
jgi:peptide/nickel transport system ATP-binding protein